MARTPENAHIWQDARVWTAPGNLPRPALPTDAGTAVNESNWFEFGILDGDDGIGESRESDETEHFGWGIGLIKIGEKNFKLTRTLSALEDNAITRSVLWPGSTNTKIVMPKAANLWLGFDTINDSGKTERLWTTRPSRLKVPSNNRNESDITKLEITANIFANGLGELFDRQSNGDGIPDQLVTITGSPTGGTFTLSVGGVPTSGIAYNAAASAVQSALVALSTVGAGKATVTGSAGGPYTVAFDDSVSGSLTASGSGLTPSGGVTVSAA